MSDYCAKHPDEDVRHYYESGVVAPNGMKEIVCEPVCISCMLEVAVAEERERLIKIMWAVSTEKPCGLREKRPWNLKKDIETAIRQEPKA